LLFGDRVAATANLRILGWTR